MNYESMRVVAARVLACGLLALLGACGGSGGSGSADTAPPPPAVASVYAGSLQAAGSRDGVGAVAQFRQPKGVAQDAAGTIYVADTGNHTIRKVTPQGAVTTLAGAAGQVGSADGTGAASRFSSPVGLALDATGNLYVADSGNHTVRKIGPAGLVTTLVGTAGQAGSTDGPAAVARLDKPSKVVVDAGGTLYVVTPLAVRKVTADGSVTTLPAQPRSGLQFSAIAVDGAGNVFVAEISESGYNSIFGGIRKFNAQGQVLPFGGSVNGVVSEYPADISVDAAGNLFVANNGFRTQIPGSSEAYRTVVRFSPDGTKTILAGVDGEARTVDGPMATARLRDPKALAVGPNGRIALVQTLNSSLRVIDAQGTVTTIAGGEGGGYVDAQGTAARFEGPQGLAAGPDGSLYVADHFTRNVRKVSPSGLVTSLTPPSQYSIVDSIAVGSDGTVYAADLATKFNSGSVYRLGPPRSPFYEIGNVLTLAVEPGGNVLVVGFDRIVSVSPDGSARTLIPAISGVRGIAGVSSGRIYFITTDNTVATLNTEGQVQLLAGAVGQAGHQDGAGSAARFDSLSALTVDALGNLYAGERGRIRKITPEGVVTTVADLSVLDGYAGGGVRGLTWFSGALYATLQNAIIRIAPVN